MIIIHRILKTIIEKIRKIYANKHFIFRKLHLGIHIMVLENTQNILFLFLLKNVNFYFVSKNDTPIYIIYYSYITS